MTDSYRRTRKEPATQAFKEEFFRRAILKSLNWKGTHMLWPYNWNGYRRFARVRCDKLFGAVEFDMVCELKEPPAPAVDSVLEEANALLRTAYQIAAREGKDTNWKDFTARLDAVLRTQHELMYPKKP